jgi:hypothetical protein
LAYTIGPREIGLRSAFRESLDGFLALVSRQRRRAPKTHPTGFCTLSTLTCARLNEFTLELRKPAKNGEHQSSVGCRRVCPGVGEGPKTSARLGDRVEDIEQIASRPSEPIQARDHQHVTFLQAPEQLGKFGPVGASAADLL